MHVILVLGHKPTLSGMAEEFRRRLKIGVERLRQNESAILVISGGETRSGLPSEAVVGYQQVPEELRERVWLETESRTTSENIERTRELLEGREIKSLTIPTTEAHAIRVWFLLKRLWPEVVDKVIFSDTPSSLLDWLANAASLVVNVVDPNNRLFMPIVKKLFRNG